LINRKWIRGGCIAAVVFMAATLFVEAQKIGQVNTLPHLMHKLEHLFYYGTMAWLLAMGLGRRWFWIALIVVPMIGALDEWHQFFVPGRGSSAWDWATDAVGAAVAVWGYRVWMTRRSNRDEVGRVTR
jgi:VanZ family protein